MLLKAVSEEHGVAARIIATSDDIDALVLDDDADVPALKGWRRKLFGDKALAIKHGRIGLAATRKGIVEIRAAETRRQPSRRRSPVERLNPATPASWSSRPCEMLAVEERQVRAADRSTSRRPTSSKPMRGSTPGIAADIG